LDVVSVKGKQKPVSIYQIMGRNSGQAVLDRRKRTAIRWTVSAMKELLQKCNREHVAAG
jgi:hypothetical protein